MEPPAIRGGGVGDRISGLPDELLHIIICRLPSAAAAARTSVLSRRWRDVWTHMPVPELVLGGRPAHPMTPSALLDSINAALKPPAAPTRVILDSINAALKPPTLVILDSIDAALKPPAAPTLRSLKIDVSGVVRCHVPAHRISPWLRFASQRVAGKLHLRLHLWNGAQRYGDNMEELALPICARATEIDLDIADFFLRPPPTGSFSLLTDLYIQCGQMDGGELGRLVSSPQCPRLRNLHLSVSRIAPVREVSIRSESLQCLNWRIALRGKLEVAAPMLQEISVSSQADACIVVAPKLEKVVWHGIYDPGRHQVSVAGRHLQSLSICHAHAIFSCTRLMEEFDTVSELKVNLGLQKGIAEYATFLKEMDKLPICETLVVVLLRNHHAFAPTVLHLLRGCSCIRKFKLIFNRWALSELSSCTMSGCPCHLPENYRLDDITFDSLEEIEIYSFTGSAEEVEFVLLLLSRCNSVILKTVDFRVPLSVHVSSEIMEAVQKIRSICHPNSKVQFNLH